MTPQNSQRKKVYVLAGISILSIVLIITVLLQNGGSKINFNDPEQSNITEFKTKSFSVKIPKGYSKSSLLNNEYSFEYTPSKDLPITSIKVKQYIYKSSSKDIGALKDLSSSFKITELNPKESGFIAEKDKEYNLYFVKDGSIWRISILKDEAKDNISSLAKDIKESLSTDIKKENNSKKLN